MIKQKIKIKPLSVNKLWRGRRFKTKTYKDYELELTYLLKAGRVQRKIKLGLEATFGVSNMAIDIDNLLKAFLDILQTKYNFNDNQIYEIRLKKRIVKKGEEFINFKLKKL